jgi:hypothetical protein
MNFLCRGVLSLGVFAAAVVSSPVASQAEEAKPVKSGGFVFSLMPKSLQKNPRLEFNIMTEMTAEGRKVTPPTPQAPAYYISQAGGAYNGGVGAEHNLKAPPVEKLQQMMEKSLADGGYFPADGAAKPPSVAIIYHWGSHSFHPPSEVTDDTGAPVEQVPEVVLRKALLDRAMLLGGIKFAKEVSRAMEQVDQKASMQRSFVPAPGSDIGGSVADMMRDPFDELRTRSADMDRLVDELFSSSFFVVASAYDYAALAKGQRRLLWRTKMTVNSLGVNMTESIPPLIASAGAYLGRETKDPVVLAKRISREGKVEMGTPTVVPDTKAPPAKPAEPAKDNTKR